MVINCSLLLVAALLLLNLFEVRIPSLGKVHYVLDTEPPLCVTQWKDHFSSLDDINQCCLSARQQLYCDPKVEQLSLGRTDIICGARQEHTLQFHLNRKAYGYCQQQVIWPS